MNSLGQAHTDTAGNKYCSGRAGLWMRLSPVYISGPCTLVPMGHRIHFSAFPDFYQPNFRTSSVRRNVHHELTRWKYIAQFERTRVTWGVTQFDSTKWLRWRGVDAALHLHVFFSSHYFFTVRRHQRIMRKRETPSNIQWLAKINNWMTVSNEEPKIQIDQWFTTVYISANGQHRK